MILGKAVNAPHSPQEANLYDTHQCAAMQMPLRRATSTPSTIDTQKTSTPSIRGLSQQQRQHPASTGRICVHRRERPAEIGLGGRRQYPDFFTVTPSMDVILDSFSAQSALWLETPPTIPSSSQFAALLTDAGALHNPTRYEVLAIRRAWVRASTSQLPQQSPSPLALSQGTSRTMWPLTASPEPSSSWQEPPHHYQNLHNPSTHNRLLKKHMLARRVGMPRIRHDSTLRRDSLLSPPPFVRRSARPKTRVNYNYDPCPPSHMGRRRKVSSSLPQTLSTPTHQRRTQEQEKEIAGRTIHAAGWSREVFVCSEGECANQKGSR
ncbi:Mitochondrial inner membrane protease atp [Salix suchowensis]|nr:Mitochondrial inner membrane protease atp [Salix suchowensis]